MILLAVGLIQQCVSYWSSMITRYSVIAITKIVMVPLLYCLIPQPSHLLPAPTQSTSRHMHHDPITSLQTFRDILEHGSELSDTPPKYHTALESEHPYDGTDHS